MSDQTTKAEAELVEWARVTRDRDNRIRRALNAGITKHRIHTLTGISRATIDRIVRTDPKEKAMSTTTEYGSWYNFERSNSCVEDTVAVFLAEYADDYDINSLVDAYRSAINDALPEYVSLNGDQFYGPYPKGDDIHDQIVEAIESVDLGALAAEYDKS